MSNYVPAVRKEYNWESDNPYYEGRKYPEPTVCPECSAVFKDGRWQWPKNLKESISRDANRALCPACRRKRDKYPGGIVRLSGEFLKKHREEIINRIKNVVRDVSSKRPLQRILWSKEDRGEIEIATTSEHLARLIGEAVNRSFKGELKVKYNQGEKLARVYWKRDL